jgi:formamidopyrimidine-DNA glycosylase
MPELPEVETVVRELAGCLPGHRIEGIQVRHPDLLDEPSGRFQKGLLRSTFRSVRRRGKNIVLELSPPQVLVVNLGMTGRLLFFPGPREDSLPAQKVAPHQALEFRLEPPGLLRYVDPRRFGRLRRFAPVEWETESKRLGPEPLDPGLAPSALLASLQRSRSPVRSWLLDQTRIAGIGNIYAAEALFRAGIHPRRPAGSLGDSEAESLLDSLRSVLREAIRARGTTLKDFRTASGELGEFGPSLLVYAREGQPCVRCNALIRRTVFGNRSAFFCPQCQPQP